MLIKHFNANHQKLVLEMPDDVHVQFTQYLWYGYYKFGEKS